MIWSAVGVALVFAVACRGNSTAATDVVRTDSAGVRLITSGARDTVLPWTFKEIDVFRDSLGEPWRFTDVVPSRVLADRAGRTYVVTREPSIVRFDRAGRFDRTIGQRGSGPGEFELPLSIGSQGDTIFVNDAAKQALVRFLPDLTPTSDRRLEGALASADLLFFRTGGLWFRQRDVSDSIRVSSVFADTLGGAPLKSVRDQLSDALASSCTKVAGLPPIFAPQLPMHASDARLLVNVQPVYELWLYEGPRALASIRRPLTPRAPSEADVRALYPNGMKFALGGGQPDCTIPVEEVGATQGLAPTYPLVFAVVLLPDGTSWALRTPAELKPAVVDVFNSEGVYVGSTTGMGLPLAMLPNGELLFARDDELTGSILIVRMKGTR